MSCDKALMALNRIRDRYNAIPAPIYKHADLTVLREDFNQLKKMKELLRDNAEYHKLISSMGKVLSSMQPSNSEWQNISERSVNKAIRPTSRFNSDQDGKTEWDNRYGHQQAIIPHRSWSARHFMVLDIVGYSYMLEFGNGNLPKKNLPLFNNANDITLKNDDFVVEISDKQFRKFSSLSIKSKNIYQLLQEVSSSTFKLNYPVRLPFHKSGKSAEDSFSMCDFNSFFSLASISGNNNKTYEIRFDTLLAQLFLHNLQMRNCDYISASNYHLPQSAQILYRRYILNNNYPQVSVNISNIIQALGYTYSNRTDLINTITTKAIKPLITSKILASYSFVDGLSDKKFVLRKVSKSGGRS